jgi:hypothetical protein
MTKLTQIAASYIAPASAETSGLRASCDIEADGLVDAATKIHCVVVVDLDSDQAAEYGPEQIDEALAHLGRLDYLIGHNICCYDLPLLERLRGWRPKAGCSITDTLVTSRLIFPNLGDLDDKAAVMGDPPLGELRGRHSLEAWGARLGKPKIGIDVSFAEWSPELQARCVRDTELTKALYHFLQSDGQPREALELEHRTAEICSRMTADGTPFDTAAAERLQQRWQARCEDLEMRWGSSCRAPSLPPDSRSGRFS